MPAATIEAPRVGTISVTDTSNKTIKALGWQVIIWNDDVNTFQHVESCLQKHLHYEQAKATKTTKEINDKGKAIVYQGHKEKAEFYCESLQSEGLNATLSK